MTLTLIMTGDSTPSHDRPTAIDLFCGAGGLTAGIARAGFDVVAALDSSPPAADSCRLNFQHPVLLEDIAIPVAEFRRRTGIEGKPIDLVVGGPPCQGFSVQRIGTDIDERNDLIHEFARYVLDLRPGLYLMENVPGLLGRRGRLQVSRFENDMRQGGYSVCYVRVNAADYGVPQLRRRVFFYGWPVGRPPFRFPRPICSRHEYRTVWDAIGDLIPPPEDFSPAVGDRLHRRFRMSDTNRRRLRLVPPGGGMDDLPVDMRVDAHKNGPDKIGHRHVYGRLAADKPAGTITARFDSFTRGKFAHPFEDRNISLREGARLQTFPDSHRFVGTQEEIAALIGNAVPMLLAQAIGGAAFDYLTGCGFVADTEELDLFSVRRSC